MYTFKNTEQNNHKATEFETKSMLYLFGMMNDSNEVETVAVDCFNDVTGICDKFERMWDVQSKNHVSMPPSKIALSLLTLYKNYTVEFSFYKFILFLPKVNIDYLLDNGRDVYNFSNFNEKCQKRIIKKLNQEINDNDCVVANDKLAGFLDVVLFVQDHGTCVDYIKGVSNFKNEEATPVNLYNSIFNEIRDRQSVLKNSHIEMERILFPKEVLKFNRHITKLDIQTLVINRLVGVDVFSGKGIPFHFLPFLNTYNPEEVKDIVLECNANLSRCFFDKNGCGVFWRVSELIVYFIKCGSRNVDEIIARVNEEFNYKIIYLNDLTMKYLISLILDGVTT